MQIRLVSFFLAVALVPPLFSQTPVKKPVEWTDRAEFELYQEAQKERDPFQRIQLLLRWEIGYPKTELQSLRLTLLARAYKEVGLVRDAFVRAAEFFNTDGKTMSSSLMVASYALALTDPSLEQIRVTEDAAHHLLSMYPQPEQVQPEVKKPTGPATDSDIALIREWRRDKAIPSPTQVQIEVKAAAEKALAWAKSFPH